MDFFGISQKHLGVGQQEQWILHARITCGAPALQRDDLTRIPAF
jgi:hypothetical protein